MKIAAGVLAYKKDENGSLKFLLVHNGGPYNKNKDLGFWSIPKGEIDNDEDFETTARREFKEEIGTEITDTFINLGEITQAHNRKVVHGFGIQLELPDKFIPKSNNAEIEWPPRTGKMIEIPEVDKAEYFDEENAKLKINVAQASFIDRLIAAIENRE